MIASCDLPVVWSMVECPSGGMFTRQGLLAQGLDLVQAGSMSSMSFFLLLQQLVAPGFHLSIRDCSCVCVVVLGVVHVDDLDRLLQGHADALAAQDQA